MLENDRRNYLRISYPQWKDTWSPLPSHRRSCSHCDFCRTSTRYRNLYELVVSLIRRNHYYRSRVCDRRGRREQSMRQRIRSGLITNPYKVLTYERRITSSYHEVQYYSSTSFDSLSHCFLRQAGALPTTTLDHRSNKFILCTIHEGKLFPVIGTENVEQ